MESVTFQQEQGFGGRHKAAFKSLVSFVEHHPTADLRQYVSQFTELFGEQITTELLALAEVQRSKWPEAKRQADEEFAQVCEWIKTFFTERGSAPYYTDISSHVEQLCRKATGLGVRLTVSRRSHQEVSVGLSLNPRNFNRHMTIACRGDLPTIKPSDLPVEYA